MNHKSKDLERMAFGIATMFGVYWLYSCFIREYLPITAGLKTLLGLVLLYIIGLGLFISITKKVPTQEYTKKKVSFKTILLCFLLQFTAIIALIVIGNILTVLGINTTPTIINKTPLYMCFMLLIFNPIAEEFVFRKIFADKLLKYGQYFYMLVSSFCFAIVHGVSLGIPQIFYTFILGMIWSYIMAKTGDIKLVIILHSLSNFFGNIVTQSLLSVSMTAAGIYSMLLILLGVTGLILFLINKKKVIIDGTYVLFRKSILKEMFGNKGVLFYTILTLVVMILK